MVKLVERALNPNRRKFLDDAPALSVLENAYRHPASAAAFSRKAKAKQSELPYYDVPGGNSWFEGKLFAPKPKQ